MLWARGAPSFLSFRFPRIEGGRRADKAQCPDCSGRVVRIAPDDEVHLRCTPRLAARQRGILAFVPLTVVGPGRLDSGRRGCPSTAGGRRLRESFRSQVPLPFPAYRTPPEGAPVPGSGWITHRVKEVPRQQLFHLWLIGDGVRQR